MADKVISLRLIVDSDEGQAKIENVSEELEQVARNAKAAGAKVTVTTEEMSEGFDVMGESAKQAGAMLDGVGRSGGVAARGLRSVKEGLAGIAGFFVGLAVPLVIGFVKDVITGLKGVNLEEYNLEQQQKRSAEIAKIEAEERRKLNEAIKEEDEYLRSLNDTKTEELQLEKARAQVKLEQRNREIELQSELVEAAAMENMRRAGARKTTQDLLEASKFLGELTREAEVYKKIIETIDKIDDKRRGKNKTKDTSSELQREKERQAQELATAKDQLQSEIEDDESREVRKSQEKYDKLIEILRKNNIDTAQVIEAGKAEQDAIEMKYAEKRISEAEKLAAKEKEIRDKTAEDEKRLADKRIANEKRVQQAKFQMAQDGIHALASLLDALSNDDEKNAKKAFENNKKRNIAIAVIDTFMGAQKAFNSQLTPGDPSTPIRAFIAAGIATASGLARVAAIKKTKFGDTTSSSPDTAGVGNQSPQESGFQQTGFTALPQTGERKKPEPVKVYVLESEISKTQTDLKAIKAAVKL